MKHENILLQLKTESKKGGLRRSISFLLSLVLLLSSVNLPVIAMAEETAGPVICGKEAHEHTEACYAPVLTCGEEERDAVTETVRVFAPQYSVHQHTEACYNANGEVQCGYLYGLEQGGRG